MKKQEIIALAQKAIQDRDLPFQEPLFIRCSRKYYFFGDKTWYIRTNSSMRGGNVNIWIDDKTGTVLRVGFANR